MESLLSVVIQDAATFGNAAANICISNSNFAVFGLLDERPKADNGCAGSSGRWMC
jgi:hypothetical protein